MDNDLRCRNNNARKISFRDQARIVEQGITCIDNRIGKKLPGKHACQNKERIVDMTRFQIGNAMKKQSKEDHIEQGAHNSPGNTKKSLLIAHQNIPPSQKEEKIAITDERF